MSEGVVDLGDVTVSRMEEVYGPAFPATMLMPSFDDSVRDAFGPDTIAHRKAIDILRRRARTASPAGDAATVADSPATRIGPGMAAGAGGYGSGDLTEPSFYGPELVTALRALPPKQQAAVVHHYLADLPYREVGQIMGISPEAARRNAADGIAALRSRYLPPTHPDDRQQEPNNV